MPNYSNLKGSYMNFKKTPLMVVVRIKELKSWPKIARNGWTDRSFYLIPSDMYFSGSFGAIL